MFICVSALLLLVSTFRPANLQLFLTFSTSWLRGGPELAGLMQPGDAKVAEINVDFGTSQASSFLLPSLSFLIVVLSPLLLSPAFLIVL